MEKSSREPGPDDSAIPAKVTRLSSAMSRSSGIGFAILDRNLRFRAVNHVVVATHGLSAEEHIGSNIQDVAGELAAKAGPALQRVLHTHKELYFETQGKLPNRTYTGSWVNHFFPVEVSSGKVHQVGVLAVEITDLRNLDELYAKVTGQLFHGAGEREVALSKELHSCIGDYKIALGRSLASISSSVDDPQSIVDTFTDSMRLLDQRMEALISAIHSCFPLGREQ